MAGERSKKETVQFNQTINAGQSVTLAYLVKSAGTVELIFGKFYPGQEGTLQVRPYLTLNGDRSEELVTYPAGTNRYISGDDRVYNMPIDFEVINGDQIKVDVKNTSTFPYTLDISFIVDYVGGVLRVV